MALSLGDWLTSINSSKVNLLDNIPNKDEEINSYSPYIISKLLSYHPDAILYVNEINQRPFLDKEMQYNYLRISLRPRKRFGKWKRAETDEELNIVRQYFGYNEQKATEALLILSKDDLTKIRKALDKGGRVK